MAEDASSGAFLRTSMVRSQSVPRPGRVLPISRRDRFGPNNASVDAIPQRSKTGESRGRNAQPFGPFDYDGLTAELDRLGVDYRPPETLGGVRRNPDKLASHIKATGGNLAGHGHSDPGGKGQVSTAMSGYQSRGPSKVRSALDHASASTEDTRREEADLARLLRFRRRRKQTMHADPAFVDAGASPAGTSRASPVRAGRQRRSSSMDRMTDSVPSDQVPVRGGRAAGPPSSGEAMMAAAIRVAPPAPETSRRIQAGLATRSRNLREVWMSLPRDPVGRVTVASMQRGLSAKGIPVETAELSELLHGAAKPDEAASAMVGVSPGAAVTYPDFVRAVQWTRTIDDATASLRKEEIRDSQRRASATGGVRFREPVRAPQFVNTDDADSKTADDHDGSLDAEAEAGHLGARVSAEELLHREHQRRERRLTTVLGMGVAPDELPAAGAVPAKRAWAEPVSADAPHTLPSRGEVRMAQRMAQQLGDSALSMAAAGADQVRVHHARRDRLTERQAYVAKVQERVRDRLNQVFGAGAAAHRKAFLRFARTSDGSTDVRSATEGLRGLGIKMSVKDMAGLIAAANPTYQDPAVGKGPGRKLQADTRVSFSAFASAVEAGAAKRSTIPQPYGDESRLQRSSSRGGMAADDISSSIGGTRSLVSAGHGGASVRTGLTDATSKAMAALAASGLGHHDRVVRDVCFKIKARIDQLGMTPSETFLRIDAQRDGLLTHDEVRDGFNRMGVVLSDNEMAAVVKAVDKRGTGIVDRGGLVTALFPPDADVMEATAGTEHAAIAAEARASGGAAGDNTAHRPHRRMAPVSLRQSLSSPQVQAAKMAETAEAPESSAAGIGRSKLDEDFFDHDDLVATGADQIEDSWVRSERVDEAGMYTTGRDEALADMNAAEFRRREFHKPPPHYNLAVPRDAHGTTAPFLARAGQVGEDGAQLGDGHDVGFAELAASHGPLPTKKLAARKKQNALLRRVFRSLEAKGGRDAARRLFMRVNVNHDAKVEYKELREGLARDGVALTDPEFRMLMNRLDSDRNGAINYSELARAMKQDDPLPDETDEHLVGTGIKYRPNRYNPPPGMGLTPGQGAPRVAHDSRGARAAIDGLEAPAVAAATLEEARMSQEVVDRMKRKRASLRQTWLRVKDAASSTIAARDLRKRLVDAGVTVSDKQVRAFLTGGGSRAMPQQVSFSQFVELSRPRAFVDDPRRLGQVSALQPRLRTIGRPNDIEGIGRFGAAPQPPQSDEVPGYLADYGFKTNTDPAGIMDPEGRMGVEERAEADREANQSAREAAEGDRRDDAALGVGGDDSHRHVERHAQSPAARRKSGVFRAAMQEHAGLPAAGTLTRRFQGRGVVADGPYHAYRLWSGDRVRDMLGGGGGVHVVAQDDFDVGRVSFTTTRAEQRRRRRRHSMDIGSGSASTMPAAPPAGVVSGVFADLDVARQDLDRRAPAFAQTYSVPASPVVRERIARAAAAAQGSAHPARRHIAFAGDDDTTASHPQRSVRSRRPTPPPRHPTTGNAGRESAAQPPAPSQAAAAAARFHHVAPPPPSMPAARPAGLDSSITSPVAQAGRAGRRHFGGGSGAIRDQHHSNSGIFSSFGYGDYQPKSKRMGTHHALKPMGHF